MPEDKGEKPEPKPEGETPTGSDDGDMLTVESLQSQLADVQKALKAANSESAARRKKLQAFEDAKTARDEEEMSELEKANAKITEMETERKALQQNLMDTKLNAAIDVSAQTLKFRKVSEARMLVNRDALKYGDDGEWTGVDAALEALAKDSPHLINVASTTQDTDGQKRNTAKATANAAKQAEWKARYGDPKLATQ